MITLYDLSAKDSIKSWSLNVWKVRYVLNLKILPYQTIYLEFPSLALVLQQATIPPITRLDGTTGYTVPAIVDSTTGARISDSFKIAEYLETQYPETPKAFPFGSIALQAAFAAQFCQKAMEFVPLIVSKTPNILNPVSVEWFYQRVRVGNLNEVPVGEELEQLWKKAEDLGDWLGELYSKSDGPFFMGEAPSYADFVVGGVLEEMKVLGDWDRIKQFNKGRWERLSVDLEKYSRIEE